MRRNRNRKRRSHNGPYDLPVLQDVNRCLTLSYVSGLCRPLRRGRRQWPHKRRQPPLPSSRPQPRPRPRWTRRRSPWPNWSGSFPQNLGPSMRSRGVPNRWRDHRECRCRVRGSRLGRRGLSLGNLFSVSQCTYIVDCHKNNIAKLSRSQNPNDGYDQPTINLKMSLTLTQKCAKFFATLMYL